METKAQHTGDNATLSYEATVGSDESLPRTIQLVTKPYIERRAKATFEKQWPDQHAHIFVTSPQRTFEDYCNEDQLFEVCVHIMVGGVQRIIEYPKRGLQSEQIVPDSVHKTLDSLIAAGYTKHLMK